MRFLGRVTTLLSVVMLDYGCVHALQQQSQAAPSGDTDSTADRPLTGHILPCVQGRIEQFECENVELLAYLPRRVLGNATGNDVWGWHDSTTGREFVIIGGSAGRGAIAFAEVTDPANPKYLGLLHAHERVDTSLAPHRSGAFSLAQNVKVYGHYAFLGTAGMDNGLQIFDLTQLRDVKNPPAEFHETAHYDSLGGTHTITLNQATGFLYGNGGGDGRCGGGLHMIDVRVPTKPAFAGCYIEPLVGGGTPGWVHDSECVIYHGPDRDYKGHEICLAAAVDGLAIADVTDKQHPKTIAIVRYPDIAYAHQGWLTEDHRYFFLDDEGDEVALMDKAANQSDSVGSITRVFDLEDLDDPIVLPSFTNWRSRAIDHNLYIRGRYMYQGNYGAGLRIIDVADPKHLKEVGYLTNAGSAWGTYPFFKKDVVAMSTDNGLFLVRLRRQ